VFVFIAASPSAPRCVRVRVWQGAELAVSLRFVDIEAGVEGKGREEWSGGAALVRELVVGLAVSD
jgi:hypothetical protein